MIPTATAQDFKRRGPNSKQQGLPEAAYNRMLPTPRATKTTGTDRDDFTPSLPGLMNKGLLPTPKATEIEEHYNDWKERMAKSGNPKNTGKTTCNIGTMAVSGMLPTPATRDWKDTMNGKDAPSIGVTRGYSLGQKISSMLPTPTCNDMKNASLPPSQGNRADSIVKRIVAENPQAGESQQLNPAFVGEMMGFPERWTLQPYINGGSKIGEPTDFSSFPNFNPTISKGDIQDMEGITASKWRNESIKACGNAIVPQVAYNIFKTINNYGTGR